MPALDRSTLQRPACLRCRALHDPARSACPPRGVWLFAWSLAINGRHR